MLGDFRTKGTIFFAGVFVYSKTSSIAAAYLLKIGNLRDRLAVKGVIAERFV